MSYAKVKIEDVHNTMLPAKDALHIYRELFPSGDVELSPENLLRIYYRINQGGLGIALGASRIANTSLDLASYLEDEFVRQNPNKESDDNYFAQKIVFYVANAGIRMTGLPEVEMTDEQRAHEAEQRAVRLAASRARRGRA